MHKALEGDRLVGLSVVAGIAFCFNSVQKLLFIIVKKCIDALTVCEAVRVCMVSKQLKDKSAFLWHEYCFIVGE